MAYILSLFFSSWFLTSVRTRVFCLVLGSLLVLSPVVRQLLDIQGFDILHFYSLICMVCSIFSGYILRGWERWWMTTLCLGNSLFYFTASVTKDLWLLINYNTISELFIMAMTITITFSEKSVKKNIIMTSGSLLIFILTSRYL